MFCPLNPNHRLKEVAPSLWQCPECGSGPRGGGRFPFWALSCVEIYKHSAEGLATRYDPRLDIYVVTALEWEVDDEGRVLPGSLTESFLEYLSTKKEVERGLLPVVSKEGSGCSSALRRMMFPDPEGLKEV